MFIFDRKRKFMNFVYLQLGSNLGNRTQLLTQAISLIESLLGKILNSSKVYESSPWRVEDQSYYLNQVLKVETKFNAEQILNIILNIEDDMGRKRFQKWGERLIDIDILFYNNDLIETQNLCVPHKHLAERKFVLLPLNEIAQDYIHPKYNLTVSELLNKCHDNESVFEYVK